MFLCVLLLKKEKTNYSVKLEHNNVTENKTLLKEIKPCLSKRLEPCKKLFKEIKKTFHE